MSENINLPSLNVSIPDQAEKQLIPNEKILNYYEEVIQNIQEDRMEADTAYRAFLDLAINGGDSSAASKEAAVNLLKLKTDSNDKMIKILDLWTRIHLRDRDTMPKYLAVQQNNKIEQSPVRDVRHMQDMMKSMKESHNE